MTSPISVTAIVVTWRSAATIGDCLRTLASSSSGIEVRIVVVDNASADETLEIVSAVAPDATVIANATNRGLAAANNQGLERAESDWILISNPDVRFEADTVRRMVECAQRHPDAGFVIPQLRNEDGSIQTSVGDLPRLREALLGRRFAAGKGAADGYWWDGWDHGEEIEVRRGMEACYLVNPRAVAEVGPQDPAYFLDWEGVDWSARLVDAGWAIWFTPEARVTHIGAVSTSQARMRWIVRTHRGMYRYFAYRSPAWTRPALGSAIALRAMLKMALHVLLVFRRSAQPVVRSR